MRDVMSGARIPAATGRRSLTLHKDGKGSKPLPLSRNSSPVGGVKVTSDDARIRGAIDILWEIPVFVSIMRALHEKCPNGLDVLVEFGKTQQELGELGEEIRDDDISNDGVVDFRKSFREASTPDSLITLTNDWDQLFQGKHVDVGARIFRVKLTPKTDPYGLAETIGHEIGGHVRGVILGILNDHAEWGTFAQGSAAEGSLAKKLLDELLAHKKKHAGDSSSKAGAGGKSPAGNPVK
jgi:hypothetical protein